MSQSKSPFTYTITSTSVPEFTETGTPVESMPFSDSSTKNMELIYHSHNSINIINAMFNTIFSQLPKWPIKEMTGYNPCTTFWQDFSIADVFVLNGAEPDAVQDTHDRSWPWVKEKGLGIEGLTEYIMVLNWKFNQHHYDPRPRHKELAKIYDKLWRDTDSWAMENLKDNDLDYYLTTTD